MKKLSLRIIEKVIDEWESLTDINQYRDVPTEKELKNFYKQIQDNIK